MEITAYVLSAQAGSPDEVARAAEICLDVYTDHPPTAPQFRAEITKLVNERKEQERRLRGEPERKPSGRMMPMPERERRAIEAHIAELKESLQRKPDLEPVGEFKPVGAGVRQSLIKLGQAMLERGTVWVPNA